MTYFDYTKKDDFFNFEIMWDGKSIFYPTILDECVEDFKKSSNRFFIIPIAITLERGAHSNILIYDKIVILECLIISAAHACRSCFLKALSI